MQIYLHLHICIALPTRPSTKVYGLCRTISLMSDFTNVIIQILINRRALEFDMKQDINIACLLMNLEKIMQYLGSEL